MYCRLFSMIHITLGVSIPLADSGHLDERGKAQVLAYASSAEFWEQAVCEQHTYGLHHFLFTP